MRWRIAATYVVVAMAAVGLAAMALFLHAPDDGRAWYRAVLAVALAAATAAAGGLICAGLVMRPLRRAAEMARRLAGGRLDRPTCRHLDGPLDVLAAALRETAERLDAQVREMAAERGRLEAVLAHMASGVLLIDSRGRLAVANPAAARLLSLTPGDVGRPHIEVTKNYHLSEAIDQVLSTGDARTERLTLVHEGERWVEVGLASVQEVPGEPGGVVVVLHDVTERTRLEQMRSDFLASVSHELRTPVTAIKGFAETLLEGALEDAAHRRTFVAFIDREAARLQRLVEDLLDLVRLEERRVSLVPADLDLGQLTTDTVNGLRARAATLGIDIALRLPDRPVYAFVDGGRIEQVLINLLDNALKYTPSGGWVAVSLSQEEDGTVRLEVADSGQGIGPEELKLIFERFYRVDRGRSRQTGGTGLGLAIVKQIVEAHGGRVWAESAPGRGATFIVTIPRWPPEAAGCGFPPAVAGGGAAEGS